MRVLMTLLLAGGVALGSGQAVAASCESTELFGHMETLADNLRDITRAVRGNQLAEAAARMNVVHAAIEDALPLTPFSRRELSGEALEQAQADYRAALTETRELFEQLDDALQAEDRRQALAVLSDISDARRSGHREFKDSSCG